MPNLAVMMVATGPECITFIPPLLESLKKFFPPHDAFVFTDREESLEATKIYQAHVGWPNVSLKRYHAVMAERERFSKYDYFLFIDTDMLVCQPVTIEEMFGKGITIPVHPCYPDCYERRPESKAFIEGNPTYYQACLVGGSRDEFFAMCDTIIRNIDEDESNGLRAIWLEESHINRYLMDNPPVRPLTPAYAFPLLINLNHPETWLPEGVSAEEFEPKIRHLHKTWKKDAHDWYIKKEE